MALLALLLATIAPCSAVEIPFENCLPRSYREADPPALQFVGEFVDATLTTLSNESQTLRVTMWGNVKGSRARTVLPSADNATYWNDPAQTDGKIVQQAPGSLVATTLKSQIDVLTYEPWNNFSYFCGKLTNGQCPLAPVFATNLTREQLPSVFMENTFTTSYAFTSWSAKFSIRFTDTENTEISCVSATITPDLGPMAAVVKFLPMAILVFVALATIFAAIFSPWGTHDVFRWTSNYGRDTDVIRLVTPGFGDCLQYIQFVALTGGLTLNYPGFYQPIASQLSWSALMFNESFVTKAEGYQSLRDGIYVTNASYGLQSLAQLAGMSEVADIWAGMMVWLLVIIAVTISVGQLGFGARWIYRKLKNISEEDLRSKNIPFTVGNVVRIVFNYFLLPIVALSTFQLVVAKSSPQSTVALAVITLLLIVVFAGWLLYLIITIKPRPFLFDDLPTVLLYGPLYNTYSDEAATFALVPLSLTILRGITIGAVQPKGIAQIVILAICEVFNIFTIYAVKPFYKPTSMNSYNAVFAAFRLASLLLMVAFIPEIGIDEGQRGWVGYAILVIHACVLGFGFFLNAFQTTLEVAVRLSGAGGDSSGGLTRGGLSKIFGMRQLQRREGVSRNSHHSTMGMLDKDEASKTGYIMPGGRLRSESAGSGVLLSRAHPGSSSMLDSNSVETGFAARNFDGSSTFTPTTPGEASTYSFLPSPAGPNRHPLAPSIGLEAAADPYYRPPRRRGQTGGTDGILNLREKNRGSWTSGDWSQRRLSQAAVGPLGDPSDLDAQISRGATPAPNALQPTISFAPRTDYSTREVDFYYGVRGQRLNSDAPNRKLGTGPADPTGPIASAAGWWRTIIGGKSKEKGKGFEVVRSSRMPPAMKARGGDITNDGAPQGIPVAMSTLRNGPIESDDDDEQLRKKKKAHDSTGPGQAQLLDEDGNPRVDNGDDSEDTPRITDLPPMLPGIEPLGDIQLPSRIQSKASRASKPPPPPPLDLGLLEKKDLVPPAIPRKSSKRDSGSDWSALDVHAPSVPAASATQQGMEQVTGQDHDRNRLAPSGTASRLPFERSDSHGRLSSTVSSIDPATEDLGSSSTTMTGERPTSYGVVQTGSISHIDSVDSRRVDMMASSAEVVDER